MPYAWPLQQARAILGLEILTSTFSTYSASVSSHRLAVHSADVELQAVCPSQPAAGNFIARFAYALPLE